MCIITPGTASILSHHRNGLVLHPPRELADDRTLDLKSFREWDAVEHDSSSKS